MMPGPTAGHHRVFARFDKPCRRVFARFDKLGYIGRSVKQVTNTFPTCTSAVP
jgi:hypothetical protein